MPELIESFCASKTGVEENNEDGFVVTDTVVAVFDGETAKFDFGSAQTPGSLATKALLEAARYISSDATPTEIVANLQAAVRTTAAGCEFADSSSCVAVGAVAHLPSKQVVRVGDISVGLDGVFDTPTKRVDEVAAGARAALLLALQQAGVAEQELLENDQGRELILPLLREQWRFRNLSDHEFGFAVLDGTQTPDAMVDIIDFSQATELVLATDGYDTPCATLDESEQVLATALVSDPLHLSPPGTKGVTPGNVSFDDRTYVRVRVA